MANVNQLRGRLEEFRVVELLQAMGLGYSTGALHLRRDDGRAGLIYFENGALVSATEIDTEALTLGHVLQQLNYATATQLEHVYQQQTQDPFGKRIGERLIDLGVLSAEQLDEALRTQVLWTVRELALWRSGDYEFHPNEVLPQGVASIVISAEDAALEVLRYEHEWEDQLQFLPDGMNTHVVMVFDPPLGHPLVFHPQSWRVLCRVNQHRTARRIATTLHMPELEVSRVLQPLVREGLLVPLGSQGAPGLPEGAARLSMHDFDLFSLLIEFEQDWLKRRTPTDHLVGIASYINGTMRALGRVYAENGLQLGPDTLRSLLSRSGVLEISGHALILQNNQIDLDDLAAFSRRSFEGATRGSITDSSEFYETASATLQQALRAAFEAINARVASPQDRSQNQEAWEALFQTLQSPQPFR
ncbi:MAG TPA: DUF4388 domain-containing protein [Ktedonobacterales bacterium]